MRRQAREIWVNLVRQLERSGQSQEEFARERGIPVGTLRGWIYRLRRERAEQAPLLPVRVVASTAPTARRPDDEGAVIEAALSDGLLLRFGRGATAELVAEVLSRLRRC
jgi:transposase-like protein